MENIKLFYNKKVSLQKQNVELTRALMFCMKGSICKLVQKCN